MSSCSTDKAFADSTQCRPQGYISWRQRSYITQLERPRAANCSYEQYRRSSRQSCIPSSVCFLFTWLRFRFAAVLHLRQLAADISAKSKQISKGFEDTAIAKLLKQIAVLDRLTTPFHGTPTNTQLLLLVLFCPSVCSAFPKNNSPVIIICIVPRLSLIHI